jgi:hypothetical protein
MSNLNFTRKILSKIQLHFYCCCCPLQPSGFELRNGGDADKWTRGGKSLLTDSVREILNFGSPSSLGFKVNMLERNVVHH